MIYITLKVITNESTKKSYKLRNVKFAILKQKSVVTFFIHFLKITFSVTKTKKNRSSLGVMWTKHKITGLIIIKKCILLTAKVHFIL